MKYEKLGWLAIGVALVSAACLIEPNPAFIEPEQDGTLYGPCPSGDDDECTGTQFCVTGSRQGTDWSLCTTACASSSECVIDDDDQCSDLPGDGLYRLRCAPLVDCGASNPCPDGMQCVDGILPNASTVCVWPDP
jgi:hypothetical protein